jgi:hypothetical protein
MQFASAHMEAHESACIYADEGNNLRQLQSCTSVYCNFMAMYAISEVNSIHHETIRTTVRLH